MPPPVQKRAGLKNVTRPAVTVTPYDQKLNVKFNRTKRGV